MSRAFHSSIVLETDRNDIFRDFQRSYQSVWRPQTSFVVRLWIDVFFLFYTTFLSTTATTEVIEYFKSRKTLKENNVLVLVLPMNDVFLPI